MLRLIESLTAGLVLFADLIDGFEMVPSTFEPSAGISEEVMRPTKEVVNILFSTPLCTIINVCSAMIATYL